VASVIALQFLLQELSVMQHAILTCQFHLLAEVIYVSRGGKFCGLGKIETNISDII